MKEKSKIALIATSLAIILSVAAELVPAVAEFKAELTGHVCPPDSTLESDQPAE